MPTTRLSRLAIAGLTLALASSTSPIAAAQVVTTSTGDVTAFSQKNLIDRMIVGDSIEIEIAQLALDRTQNTAVKEFANQLLTDHSAHLENLRTLAARTDVGREANPADTSGAHLAGVLKSLQSMAADSGFDRAFVQAQIAHHQTTTEALKNMRTVAKDTAVLADIDKTLPVLETHLSRANQLAATLMKPTERD